MNDILDKHNEGIIMHTLQDLKKEVPSEYYSISVPKIKIAKFIRDEINYQELSIRKLAERVGVKHPQILRVTGGENYNIETLLRILDALDLQIELRKKD